MIGRCVSSLQPKTWGIANCTTLSLVGSKEAVRRRKITCYHLRAKSRQFPRACHDRIGSHRACRSSSRELTWLIRRRGCWEVGSKRWWRDWNRACSSLPADSHPIAPSPPLLHFEATFPPEVPPVEPTSPAERAAEKVAWLTSEWQRWSLFNV